MSIPECPPCKPLISILKISPFASSKPNFAEAVTSTPPAQPISISSSSSVSRFKRISPFNCPGFRANAPVIPVSSSIVKRASKAGCAMSLLSKMDIIVATPKPLSAPKVVPLARTQSPSTYIWIP